MHYLGHKALDNDINSRIILIVYVIFFGGNEKVSVYFVINLLNNLISSGARTELFRQVILFCIYFFPQEPVNISFPLANPALIRVSLLKNCHVVPGFIWFLFIISDS